MKTITQFKSSIFKLKQKLINGLFLVIIIFFFQIIGCKSNNNGEKSKEKSDIEIAKAIAKKDKSHDTNNKNKSVSIPKKVYEIRDYVRENGKPKFGYVGGRKFKNLEKRLPIFNDKHQKINYQEWDVNIKKNGKNRGAERLITASDGSDYYTNDHYNTFQKLKEK